MDNKIEQNKAQNLNIHHFEWVEKADWPCKKQYQGLDKVHEFDKKRRWWNNK